MRQAVILFLLLGCTSLTPGAVGCYADGPENCTFQFTQHQQVGATLCSWRGDQNINLYYYKGLYYYETDWFAGLVPGTEEGKLTSRTACSTTGYVYCLSFFYKLEENNIIDLSVSIQYTGNNETESPLWIMSSSDGWDFARVPIRTSRDFAVVFRAKRRPGYIISSLHEMFIDDITYMPCSYGLYPPAAEPTATTTSTSVRTTKRTTLRILTTQTTTTTITADASADSKSSPSSTTVTPAGTTATVIIPTTLKSVGETTSKESNNIGMIVGVIAALLVVSVMVIAVLLVVLRRKNILIWNACCRDKQPKELFHMNASHNRAYSLNADDSDHMSADVTNNTRENNENHRLEARTSTYSSTNHCYMNTVPNNQSGPVYATVNKPRKLTQETPPEIKYKSTLPVYKMCNEEAANCSNAERTEYQNLQPTMGKQELDGQESSASPLPTLFGGNNLAQPQNSSSVYHILEKESGTESNGVHHVPNASVTATALGQDGDYNRLDFDTKGLGETNSFDKEKADRAIGGVYSHLNEGDEDTYNKVHREKRDEVIDGVYSHIK